MNWIICCLDENGKILKSFSNLNFNLESENVFNILNFHGKDYNNILENFNKDKFLSPTEVFIKIDQIEFLATISGVKIYDKIIIFIIENKINEFFNSYNYFLGDQTDIIRDYSKVIANLKFEQERLLKESAELSNEIARLNRELLKKTKELEFLSYHDHLTNAYNRKYLDEFGISDYKRAVRYDEDLSVVFIDIDNFKHINDKYGHNFGDEVLKNFVKIVKNLIRNDIDKLIRYGGDEFLLFLINTNKEQGENIIKRIEDILNKNNIYISYGIVNIKNFKELNLNEIITLAEELMYQMKNNKRL
ncbi:MAG: GGDEF domain-containing protein [Caldisericia bacterium]|nr:GGDEF domain-containing protein [Caldisericia bacterium]